MTHVIWKFEIPVTDWPTVEMPVGAEALHVGTQDRRLLLWAKVDCEARRERRQFAVIGTGNQMPERGVGEYIGTVQVGGFVWHVFEAT